MFRICDSLHPLCLQRSDLFPSVCSACPNRCTRSITSRTLALPPGETELRREILGLITKETPHGWRFDHRAGGFSDMAVALAMAVHLAERKTRRVPMSVHNPNSVNVRVSTGVREQRQALHVAFSDVVREIGGVYDGREVAHGLGPRGIERAA